MTPKIYFQNSQDKETIKYTTKLLIRAAISEALKYEGYSQYTEVSVTFTDNDGIKELNRKYRDIDSATDVLSFPLLDFNGENDEDFLPHELETMLGDIVISLERAREQAEEFGHSFEREVAFLCVHSMLHLLGYDHEKSEADDIDMRRRQNDIMDILGLSVKSKD